LRFIAESRERDVRWSTGPDGTGPRLIAPNRLAPSFYRLARAVMPMFDADVRWRCSMALFGAGVRGRYFDI
jgi:hypothetical protein